MTFSPPHASDSLYKDAGIHCLYCGHYQLPATDQLDNWTCNYCFSGLISFQMLLNLVPRTLFEEILSQGTKPEIDRPCPKCHRELKQATLVRADQKVTLELCGHCKLFWFEGGAIVHLVRLSELKHVMLPDPPKRGVRAPKPIPSTLPKEPENISWSAPLLFFIISFVSALCEQHPEFVSRFGFIPVRAFRENGVTWISSLFINPAVKIPHLLLLLFCGIYCERRIGSRNFLTLCTTAGVFSQLAVFFFSQRPQTVFTGSFPFILAVTSFSLLRLPYYDFLFPKEKWKSPMDAVTWTGIVSLLFLFVFVIWDMVNQVIVAGLSDATTTFTIPFVGHIPAGFGLAPYVISALAGALWSQYGKTNTVRH